ncbi:MAG: hypothetical protein JXA89_13445 [Anaerolineae bacterium]|nr:hypothetical protein [Anaerolineae bacterium]
MWIDVANDISSLAEMGHLVYDKSRFPPGTYLSFCSRRWERKDRLSCTAGLQTGTSIISITTPLGLLVAGPVDDAVGP